MPVLRLAACGPLAACAHPLLTAARASRRAPTQFVELHGAPLLQQLYDSFRRDYPEVVFKEPPRPGSLRLEDVKRSTYFFS